MILPKIALEQHIAVLGKTGTGSTTSPMDAEMRWATNKAFESSRSEVLVILSDILILKRDDRASCSP